MHHFELLCDMHLLYEECKHYAHLMVFSYNAVVLEGSSKNNP